MGNRYLFGRQCRKTINPIMALYEYSLFKIRIDPGSKKRQGLHAGDVVRRQYADGAQTFYSLMVVLATGEDSVLLSDGIHASSPFFIGALIEGDEPRDGELLDFVRLTSLTDERRSGAMYLTASDVRSPVHGCHRRHRDGTFLVSSGIPCRVRLQRQRGVVLPLHAFGRSRLPHPPD